MAQSKPSKKRASIKAARGKVRGPVRDIKPKESRAKDAFTIHPLEKEDVPTVEPLVEMAVEESDFEINKVEEDEETFEEVEEPEIEISKLPPIDKLEEDKSLETLRSVDESEARETIKVRFDKFVQLVANHDLDETIQANAEQEIIMSSNLLTELAGSRDNREERKIPLVFIVGIAIGIVLTYIFFST